MPAPMMAPTPRNVTAQGPRRRGRAGPRVEALSSRSVVERPVPLVRDGIQRQRKDLLDPLAPVPALVRGADQRPCKREHDLAMRDLGDAAGPLADHPGNRGRLLKCRCGGVENEWLVPVELVIEDA